MFVIKMKYGVVVKGNFVITVAMNMTHNKAINNRTFGAGRYMRSARYLKHYMFCNQWRLGLTIS